MKAFIVLRFGSSAFALRRLLIRTFLASMCLFIQLCVICVHSYIQVLASVVNCLCCLFVCSSVAGVDCGSKGFSSVTSTRGFEDHGGVSLADERHYLREFEAAIQLRGSSICVAPNCAASNRAAANRADQAPQLEGTQMRQKTTKKKH